MQKSSNIQRVPDEIHMQRAPKYLLPPPIVRHVKRALGVPVYAIIRFPVPGGQFAYTMKRFA